MYDPEIAEVVGSEKSEQTTGDRNLLQTYKKRGKRSNGGSNSSTSLQGSTETPIQNGLLGSSLSPINCTNSIGRSSEIQNIAESSPVVLTVGSPDLLGTSNQSVSNESSNLKTEYAVNVSTLPNTTFEKEKPKRRKGRRKSKEKRGLVQSGKSAMLESTAIKQGLGETNDLENTDAQASNNQQYHVIDEKTESLTSVQKKSNTCDCQSDFESATTSGMTQSTVSQLETNPGNDSDQTEKQNQNSSCLGSQNESKTCLEVEFASHKKDGSNSVLHDARECCANASSQRELKINGEKPHDGTLTQNETDNTETIASDAFTKELDPLKSRPSTNSLFQTDDKTKLIKEIGKSVEGDQTGEKKGMAWKKLRNTVRAATVVQKPKSGFTRRKGSGLTRQDSFLKRFSTRHRESNTAEEDSDEDEEGARKRNPKVNKPWTFVINPDENVMFYWLAFLVLPVLYNLWVLIAREAFPDIQKGYNSLWFSLDGIMDFFYLVDILVQFRTGHLEQGLIVYDSKKLASHYIKSKYFVIDIVSLLPLDVIQFLIGVHPLVRFPRFLKVYRAYQFYYIAESRTVYPNFWRVINLIHILFLGSHWFAAFYFFISKAEGFPANEWAYPQPVGEFASLTRMYLKSMYWSTLTLTTIGDLPPPKTDWEYVFTIVSYLIGVFVFATIVGQVGNVITNHNANRLEFERLLDGAKAYMRNHNVPQEMQTRVQRWYDYSWSRGRINGGGDIDSLGLLPDKLKTELALHVNLDALKKVTIFQECEPEFLHDLVLKMKAFIFTPGDLICRKGEIAREMFIIADGVLEVISDTGEIFATMRAGDFFGEIGILNLEGGINRRTADVRSVGYAELFVLSRDDVLTALKDHPGAEELLVACAKQRLLDNKKQTAQAKNDDQTNDDDQSLKSAKMSLKKLRNNKVMPVNVSDEHDEVDDSTPKSGPTQPLDAMFVTSPTSESPPRNIASPATGNRSKSQDENTNITNFKTESDKTEEQNRQLSPSLPCSGPSSSTANPVLSLIPALVESSVDMEDPVTDLVISMKYILQQKVDMVTKDIKLQNKLLQQENDQKTEQIKELQARLKTLQRALLWKNSKDSSLNLPSADI